MWWIEVREMANRLAGLTKSGGQIDDSAIVEDGAILDSSDGPIIIGARSKICAGAILKGPLVIGADCMIGNHSTVRGPSVIGDGTRIGYSCEIKQSLIAANVAIGPMCFIGDSRIDAGAYLGAMVRTSNHRLDGAEISVREGDKDIATGCTKLGSWIGANASLGIQVIILPGRVVAPDSLFEPRITIARNHPTGHYRLKQQIESV